MLVLLTIILTCLSSSSLSRVSGSGCFYRNESTQPSSWNENIRRQCVVSEEFSTESVTECILHCDTRQFKTPLWEKNICYCLENDCLEREQFVRDLCYEKITANPTCYSAKDRQPGEFEMPRKGKITAIKLTHVSGFVSCRVGTKLPGESFWGCFHFHEPSDLMTFITDDSQENVIFPVASKVNETLQKTYTLPHFNHVSNSLVLEPGNGLPYQVQQHQKLKIWYSEPLLRKTVSDNGGTHCVHVYVQYL